jgi:hypothetical protein
MWTISAQPRIFRRAPECDCSGKSAIRLTRDAKKICRHENLLKRIRVFVFGRFGPIHGINFGGLYSTRAPDVDRMMWIAKGSARSRSPQERALAGRRLVANG